MNRVMEIGEFRCIASLTAQARLIWRREIGDYAAMDDRRINCFAPSSPSHPNTTHSARADWALLLTRRCGVVESKMMLSPGCSV